TWLGHATAVIELAGTRIATGPVLRRSVLHLRRAAAVPPRTLVPLDAVLLSHLHHDHLDLPTLAALGRETRLVVPRGGAKLLRPRTVVPIHWGTYRMLGHGGHPAHIDVFREHAARVAPDVELHVLSVGGSLEL